MKKLITASFLSMALLTGGCSVVSDLTPTQSALAQLAIKASVVELVTKDVTAQEETASKIIEIATEALTVIDSGVISSVIDLDAKIQERIAGLNLSPAKAVIVDALLSIIRAEIQARVTGNVLNADTVVVVSKVLDIIISTAKIYK